MQRKMNITVNNGTIEINGEPMIAFADIDRVHGRKKGTASKAFQHNRFRFVEGRDYILASLGEINKATGKKQCGNPQISKILLTKAGYLLLTKYLDDDTAYKVQQRMVSEHFGDLPAVRTENKVATVDMNTYLAKQIEILETEAKKNAEFRDTMMKSFQVLSQIIVNQNKLLTEYGIPAAKVDSTPVVIETVAPTLVAAKPVPAKKPVKVMPYMEGYEEWRDKIMATCKGNKKTTLKNAYRRMTKNYGIVWDQLSKQFREDYGCKARSTMELAYYLEQKNKNTKGLLACNIDAVLAESKTKVDVKANNTINFKFPATTKEEVQDAIRCIAIEKGSTGRHGYLYHSLFTYMDRVFPVDWTTMCENGHKSKLDAVITNPKTKEVFYIIFNEWAEKNYPNVVAKH